MVCCIAIINSYQDACTLFVVNWHWLLICKQNLLLVQDQRLLHFLTTLQCSFTQFVIQVALLLQTLVLQHLLRCFWLIKCGSVFLILLGIQHLLSILFLFLQQNLILKQWRSIISLCILSYLTVWVLTFKLERMFGLNHESLCLLEIIFINPIVAWRLFHVSFAQFCWLDRIWTIFLQTLLFAMHVVFLGVFIFWLH